MILTFSEILHVADIHHSAIHFISARQQDIYIFFYQMSPACQLARTHNNEHGLLMGHVQTFNFS